MNKTLSVTRRILLGGILLILLAIPTIPLIITLTSWNGTCNGFTDGMWVCPWTEFFANQLGYMAVFSIMPLALFGGLWGILTAIHIVSKKQA
jgi:hypothetical protein